MAVSKFWDDQTDSWGIAQLEAPCNEVVDVLSKSRGFRKKYDHFDGSSIPASVQAERMVVAYSVAGSNWTHFEAVYSRTLNESAIINATKKLNSQALLIGMDDNTGSYFYDHYRNGRAVEQYVCTDPDFHQYTIDECKAKGWQVCDTGHRRLKTRRSVDLDSDLLASLTDELGLDIPQAQWDVAGDPPRIEQYLSADEREDVDSAYLLYLS